MSTQTREGFSTVTPYLTVSDAAQLLEFVGRIFGAEQTFVARRPDGSVQHAEVRIGDSMVMVGQANDLWKARPSTIYVYVDDPDATYRQAVEAGAKSLAAPQDHEYGERSAGFEDPTGNYWWVAKVI
jgi:PhnB protein